MIALALLSHPIDGPELKARKPAKRYQKPPRPRTEAELHGLEIANARRRENAARKRGETRA
jgi:hypothetical protein